MTKASDNVFPRLLVSEGGSTTTPAAGNVTMYAKADGLFYSKDDAGTETLMSSGAGSGIPATIFDAAGDIIVASAADTAARLAVGSEGDVLTIASSVPTWAAPAGGGGAGSLLAIHTYTLGSDVQTTGTSFADIDATNLAITFTVPASGDILFRASGFAEAGNGIRLFWGLREASSNVAGTESGVLSGAVTIDGRPNYEVVITGLTPSASITYKLAHRVASSNIGFMLGGYPIVLSVWEL